MTIVYIVVAAVSAVAVFIAGVLVGRANKNTVNAVVTGVKGAVTDVKTVSSEVVSDVKKL